MGQKFTITESDRKRIKDLYEQQSPQPISEQSEGNPITYSQIVDVPNMPKDQLYDKVKMWSASAFRSLKDVNQLDDKANGVFVAHATMPWKSNTFSMQCSTGHIDYEVKIRVKDNKFKFEITDFQHQARVGSMGACSLGFITDKEEYKTGMLGGPYNKIWIQMKEDTKMLFNRLFSSLDTTIKSVKPDDF